MDAEPLPGAVVNDPGTVPGRDAGTDFRRLFAAIPTPFLLLAPDAPRFTIKDVNDAYLAATVRMRDDLVGRGVFEAFPDNPGDRGANSVSTLQASFERALATKRPDVMPVLKYDIPRDAGGFEERWWVPVNTPVLDEAGVVTEIIHQANDVTERGRAEQALQESENRWRDVLGRMGEGFEIIEMIHAPDGRAEDFRYVSVNAAWEKQSGLPREMVVGRRATEVFPAEETDYWVSLYGQVATTGKPVRVERYFPPAQRWLEVIAYRLAANHVAVLLRDVTAPRLAEDALRQSEVRNRQILDSAIDYVIIATDLEGRITRWNEGARRVLGWTEQEMLGQTAERFFTPEDVEAGQIRKEMSSALEQGRGIDERWHQRAGGERFWASGAMTALRDEAGALAGFVKVLRDRTAERLREQRFQLLAQASEGLLEAERPDAGLNAVLEASARQVGFDQSYSYVLTPDGRHLRLSHSVGLSAEMQEALQCVSFDGPLCGIVAETRRPLVLEHLLESTEPQYSPGRAAGLNAYAGYPVDAGGKLFGVLSFGSSTLPAFDTETLSFFATLARYVSVVRERMHRETALKDTNATLEDRVEERTRDLIATEEALRQSQKMEAVGQLTGGLAHDFNNLLTGVTGSLELLQTRIAQGRIKDVDRYVNAAQGAAKRAAALTHRLLAFSRRQTLDPRPTDANRLVTGMEDMIRRTVGPEITVETALPGELWPTLVDPGQLENALLNLCINARDAMPDGGRITVETANRSLDGRMARSRDLPPGQYVSLCVSDTGNGMTPEVIAKAFDPFFTTKPIGQGTGLGLSMIYGFVRQSGGQVRIHSEEGQGATICLYLPRHLGEADPAELATELADAPRAELGQTVLVVDDEPTVRMLVTEVLEDLGYTAIEAADGAAGLKVLQSDARIDLLVTDVGLPGGMNGRQMADAARVARPDLKVLFITGYAENAVLSHGHLDPGMHVLTKPFAMEALASRIKELIVSQ